MNFDKKTNKLILLLLLASFKLPVCAQPALDFFNAASEAEQSDRWKAIHWAPNMDAAKAEAQRKHKPILVVLHNNFGGDTRSNEC